MANMSAAEVLKAELGGLQPVKTSASASPPKSEPLPTPVFAQPGAEDDMDVPGFGNASAMDLAPVAAPEATLPEESMSDADGSAGRSQADVDMENGTASGDEALQFLQGVKRKIDETDDVEETAEVEDAVPGKNQFALKVNPDGTVEQEDTVKCGLRFLCWSCMLTHLLLTDYGNLGTESDTTNISLV